MSRATKKSIWIVLAMLPFIAAAMVLWKLDLSGQAYQVALLIRSGIYICILALWGISIHRRILQVQVRRYLLSAAMLMVLWMIFKTVKFSIESIDAKRILWYLYYFPLLFIPLLGLLASMSLGKSENYCLPRWTTLLYVPPAVLLLLVLTNDFHQFAFSFPSGVLSDLEYRHEIIYFAVLGWDAACAAVAIGLMVIKSRIPQSRQILFLPLIPMALSIAYTFAYVCDVRWVMWVAGDMTVTQCLMFTCIFESCIQCGLIQSNLGYDELFEATTLPVWITDEQRRIQQSSASEKQPEEQLLQAIQVDAAQLGDHTILKRSRLRHGYVFWEEDVSELHAIEQELKMTQRELRDIGDVLAAENEQQAKLLKLTEENRLYELMEAETARQTAMLQVRLDRLQQTEDREQARKLLGQVIVLGTYIKRRSNLLFAGMQRGTISAQELRLCLNESAENLNLYGINCRIFAEIYGQMEMHQATMIYDLFEATVEVAFESLQSLLVSIEGDQTIAVHLSAACREPLQELCNRFADLSVEQDEDGLQYLTLMLEREVQTHACDQGEL